MLPCLTLSNISYVSRVKWSNPGKGVAPSPIPQCSIYWKGSLRVALDYGRQLYFPGKGVAFSPTPWCSSYWKGSLRVTVDYGRQIYLLLLRKKTSVCGDVIIYEALCFDVTQGQMNGAPNSVCGFVRETDFNEKKNLADILWFQSASVTV